MPSFDPDWIVLQDAPNPRRREKGRGMRFKTKTKQGRRLLTGVTRRRRRLAWLAQTPRSCEQSCGSRTGSLATAAGTHLMLPRRCEGDVDGAPASAPKWGLERRCRGDAAEGWGRAEVRLGRVGELPSDAMNSGRVGGAGGELDCAGGDVQVGNVTVATASGVPRTRERVR
jgi:hypothetical protein